MSSRLKLFPCLFCGLAWKIFDVALWCCSAVLLLLNSVADYPCLLKNCWRSHIKRHLFSSSRQRPWGLPWAQPISASYSSSFLQFSFTFFFFLQELWRRSYIHKSTGTPLDTAPMRHIFWGHNFNLSGTQIDRKMRESPQKNPVTFI